MTVHPLITSTIAPMPLQAAMARDLYRTKPVENAVSKSASNLAEGYAQRVKDISSEEPRPVKLIPKVPATFEQIKTVMEDPSIPEDVKRKALVDNFKMENYASVNSTFDAPSSEDINYAKSPRVGHLININPNANEVWLAHELGHAASSHTKFGDALNRLRSHPKLAAALALGGGLTAFAAGAATPGDEDLDEAILGQMALASPMLIDEALASKNALAIMNNAGRKATPGQKARLAGAYLTYLAAPISTAVIANTLGNQFDEDV